MRPYAPRAALAILFASAGAVAQAPDPTTPSSETEAEPARPLPADVIPPRAVEASLGYPDGARGNARVLLELLIDADGKVREAIAVEGVAPFSSFAEREALSWRFEPARQFGQARSARIRFEVSFAEPIEVAAPEPDAPPRPAPPTPSASKEPRAPTQPAAPRRDEEEILVTGERVESTHRLTRTEVRQLPGAFGDPFRAVESLPGVTPIVSGLPYFYVRGAPPGNVGYYLDDVRIPILFHIGAGPAVVHPAFIETVELFAGPYPARYGRFSGGIVAGHTAEPRYVTRGEASIRLVDSGAMVESQALDNRFSVMLGGRYSYTAAIISLVAPEIDMSYWDYQARASYRATRDDTLTLFGFGALDNATEQRPNGERISIFDLIFHRLNGRYRHATPDGGFWELSLLGGVDITAGDEDDGLSMQDRLLGVGVRSERPLTKDLLLRTGFDVQSDEYTVSLAEDELDEPVPEEEEARVEDSFPSRTDVVTGLNLDLVWEAEPGVRITPGVRVDLYFSQGHTFVGVEPRISAAFDVTSKVTLHHGLGIVHQMPSFVIPLPGVQPAIGRGLQRAIQHSAGVETHLPAKIEAEATVYQNIQLNLTDPLSTVHTDESYDPTEDRRGMGSGRGLEIQVKRSLSEDLGGYLSYTLAYTERSLGRYSGPSSFDRRHVVGAALGYQLGKGWIVGARGTYYTGIPGSARSGVDQVGAAPPPDGVPPGGTPTPAPAPMTTTTPPVRSDVARTDPFWRLDWRLEKRWPIGENGQWWSIVAEVLNTTLNKEMIQRECDPEGCRSEVIGPVTIPSIGVEASL